MISTRLPETFTDSDTRTWAALYDAYVRRADLHGCEQALAGREALGLSNRIENMNVVDDRLHALTGWRMHPVEDLLSAPEFFTLLRDRFFPTAPKMRGPGEIEFSRLPDLFHDVAGHLPMLADRSFGRFLSRFGAIALRHLGSSAALRSLERFYWFTTETGLVAERGQHKIFGAAILSSSAETAKATAAGAPKARLSLDEVLATDYDIFSVQHKYFVADSYGELTESLGELETHLHDLSTSHV